MNSMGRSKIDLLVADTMQIASRCGYPSFGWIVGSSWMDASEAGDQQPM
jgi:hypothetical protein